MTDEQWLRQNLQESSLPEAEDPWSDRYVKNQGHKGWKCVDGISWYQHKIHIKKNNVFPDEISHAEYDEFGVNKGMHVSWKQKGRPAPFDVVHNAPQKWLPSVLKGILRPSLISLMLISVCIFVQILEHITKGKDLNLIIDGIALMVAYVWLIPNGIILIIDLICTYRNYLRKNLHYDSIITEADIWLLERYQEHWIPVIEITDYKDGSSSRDQSMRENDDLLRTGKSIVHFKLNGKEYLREYGAELGGVNFLYCDKDNPELISEDYYKQHIIFTSVLLRNLLVGAGVYANVILDVAISDGILNETIAGSAKIALFIVMCSAFMINLIGMVKHDGIYMGMSYHEGSRLGFYEKQYRRMNAIKEEYEREKDTYKSK